MLAQYDRMFVIIDKETHNMITARDIPKVYIEILWLLG